MAQKPKTPSAIAFNPRARTIAPGTALPLPLPGGTAKPPAAERPTAINLAGKRKAVFLIGRGRIGKTTLARWIAETMADRGSNAVVAACDPLNRSLVTFLNDVAQAPST